MNDTWIKLYRKTNFNGIMKDTTAWAVFSWILINVDYETGKRTVGRFQIADELGIKPNTLYKVLHRLEKKWGVIKLVSQKTYTEVLVVNWAKYQHGKSDESNASQMPVKQSSTASNTKQEIRIKNKEDIHTSTQLDKSSKTGLIPCSDDELLEVSRSLDLPLASVKRTHSVILNKIEAGEFKNKTVYYTLKNWLLMDVEKGYVRPNAEDGYRVVTR